MTYRDDGEALRERVRALEAELAASRETIARLTGAQAPLAVDGEKAGWFLGAPATLTLERELDCAPGDEALGAIAEVLQTRLPRVGNVAQVGRTLSYRHGSLDVTIAPADNGRARVRLRASHAHLGMMNGAMPLCAMLLAAAPIGAALGPAALLVGLPPVVLLVFFLVRAFIAAQIRTNRAHLAGVVDAIATVAARHAPPTLRVAVAHEEAAAPEEEETSSEEGRRARRSE